jgi:hypothetical protein
MQRLRSRHLKLVVPFLHREVVRRLGATLEKIVFDVKSMPQMENGKWDMANLPPASSRTHISFRLPEGPRFRRPVADNA